MHKPPKFVTLRSRLESRAQIKLNIAEWNGAFGDLGTFLPFVLAYLSVLGMSSSGVFLSFGVSMIVVGLVYKTPFPVQPMKAIATVAVGQAAIGAGVSATTVSIAALLTGIIWLGLGVTGIARKIGEIVPSDALLGVIMGLGFVFMFEGVGMMRTSVMESVLIFLLTFGLLNNTHKIPAMLILLLLGMLLALFKTPDLWDELLLIQPAIHWPEFLSETSFSVDEILLALTLLVLPQLPLTFGNAYLSVIEENNRYFPDRAVSDRQVACSTGFMNLFSGMLGGVPMCHGAGGMAAHMAFGARTGGATVILGSLLCGLGLFFADSIQTLFKLFPASVLGVVLFFAGLQLAMGSRNSSNEKSNRLLVLMTAGLTFWNVGFAVLFAIVAHHAARKGWVQF